MFRNFFLLAGFIVFSVTATQVFDTPDIALTIYNNGQVMFKDTRKIQFDKGESKVYFSNVVSNVDMETVLFTPKNLAENITIYEQNLVSKSDEVLITQPTLVWTVFSPRAITTDYEISYFTSGIKWKPYYLMVVSPNEKTMDFVGWVTIENSNNRKFTNTKVKLVAGDLPTANPSSTLSVERGIGIGGSMNSYALALEPAPPVVQEKTFGNYHLYTIDKKINIEESSKKQVQLFPKANEVGIKKTYELSIDAGGRGQDNIKFQSKITFVNSKDNHLGVPLPGGTIRIFQQDSADNSAEFVGDSKIDHTARDENITISTGKAFDLLASVVALDFNQINKDVINVNKENPLKTSTTPVYVGYDARMQLKLTNRGDKPANMVIRLNNYNGDKNIIKGVLGSDWKKTNINLYEIQVTTAANETKVIVWTENYRS